MATNYSSTQSENEQQAQEGSLSQVRREGKEYMNIIIFQKQGRVPVTVLQLMGKLDGSNYMDLVDEASRAYINGVRDLLIDLSGLNYLSSAGIAAIHKTALIFRGQSMSMEESGWASYHAIDRDRSHGSQNHVKLLCPEAEVDDILDITGFKSLFEIYDNLDTAVASF